MEGTPPIGIRMNLHSGIGISGTLALCDLALEMGFRMKKIQDTG